MATCEVCDRIIRRKARLCREHYLEQMARQHTLYRAETLTCRCGRPKAKDARRCKVCFEQERPALIRENKPLRRAQLGFSPEYLQGRMRQVRADPKLLGLWSGVSATSIRRWLRGAMWPRGHEWRAVVKALDLVPCRHCDGVGLVPADRQERAG